MSGGDGKVARGGRRRAWLERLPIARDWPLARLLVTLAVCALALGLRFATDPWLSPSFPFLTFFPAVIFTAFLFGVVDGIVAGALCGLFAWYFFITPFRTLELSPGAGVGLVLYSVVVSTEILLVHLMQRANAHLEEERALIQRLGIRLS